MKKLLLIAIFSFISVNAFAAGPEIFMMVKPVVASDNFDVSTFESGDDGWTLHNGGGSGAGGNLQDTTHPHGGTKDAQISGGDDGEAGPWYDGYISKTLNIVPGSMTLWRYNNGADVKVTIGGTTVLDWTGVGGELIGEFRKYTITVTQTGSLEVRIYSHYSVDDGIYIDDISIPVAE